MAMTKLYALRGVSRECPENTLAAVRAAIAQEYDGVVLDVQVTADGIPVIGRQMDVSAMTYGEAERTDVGESFARRFRGETIPSLEKAMETAGGAGLKMCLIMDRVAQSMEEQVYRIAGRGKGVMFCFSDPRRAAKAAETVPGAALGYHGELSGEARELLENCGDSLTVWTSRPERGAAFCGGRFRLGIVGVTGFDQLNTVLAGYAPAAVCTEGEVKNQVRCGFKADVHLHSLYSQDSERAISDIQKEAAGKGIDLICITDHCDLRAGLDPEKVLSLRARAAADIRRCGAAFDGVQTLAGVELGGGFMNPELAEKVTASERYDMVLGSVHGLMFRGERKSTGRYDFGSADEETIVEYFDRYLEAELYVAENLDIDVLAHLTYILRYINGKYGRNLDWRIRETRIRRILAAIIRRGIPLEINTSCLGGAYDQWLPSREIVDLYLEMGGYLFTFGSDAHTDGRIGRCFEDVRKYLRSKGVRFMIYFKDRVPHQYFI